MDWQFLRALLSLLVFLPLVLGLAYLATRYLASWRYRWQGGGPYMEVVEHLALGPRTGLYVVRLGSNYYLLGSTEGGLSLLKELEDYPETVAAAGLRLPAVRYPELLGLWRRVRRGGGDGGAG